MKKASSTERNIVYVLVHFSKQWYTAVDVLVRASEQRVESELRVRIIPAVVGQTVELFGTLGVLAFCLLDRPVTTITTTPTKSSNRPQAPPYNHHRRCLGGGCAATIGIFSIIFPVKGVDECMV